MDNFSLRLGEQNTVCLSNKEPPLPLPIHTPVLVIINR